MSEPFLVDGEWLEQRLGDENLRILDCMVFVHAKGGFGIESGHSSWAKEHIPGSQFADLLSELADSDSPIPFMMPKASQFSEALSAYGIDHHKRIVLYDSGMNMWAARVWWMLRAYGIENASILSGGLTKWKLEGRPLSTDKTKYPRSQVEVQLRPELVATKSEVKEAVDRDNYCLINALSTREYEGRLSFYGQPGHIPNSVNVPARSLVNKKNHAYLPLDELLAQFSKSRALEKERIITYCGGGAAGSSAAFVLTLLGAENVAVYDGSLIEWSLFCGLPMVTGMN